MQPHASSRFLISANRETVRLGGDISRSVRILADAFFAGLPRLPSERCLDLLHIATGVYAADRMVRHASRANDFSMRTIDLSFGVRDVEFWSDKQVSQELRSLLVFLTDDDWQIQFDSMHDPRPGIGHQHPLSLPKPYDPDRIALYSGGLDSAAGLAHRITSGIGRYALVTVGHQSWLRKKATEQLLSLQNALGITPLLHSTLVTAIRAGQKTRMSQQELSQRSRSFLFCACAISVASAYGINEIDVFENGVGAVNFPLMTGMLLGGLATRGSHPTFLRRMSALGSVVTETSIRFNLPFAMKTKAEVLAELEPLLVNWARQSRSCVHSSWRIVGKSHCGTCPACIERRQAFIAAGFDDDVHHYSTDILTRAPEAGPHADYFRLYRAEAESWLMAEPRTRRRMDAHLRFTEMPDTDYQKIIDLQTRHSQEVRAVYGRTAAIKAA